MQKMRTGYLILLTAAFVVSMAFVGCGRSAKAQPQLAERVRQEVAKILKKDPSQIDIQKPLGIQGADELDIVEIVMAVEERFKVEIPDSALGQKSDKISKDLTVQKLADIVATEIEKQKR